MDNFSRARSSVDRAVDFGSTGREFESLRARHGGSVVHCPSAVSARAARRQTSKINLPANLPPKKGAAGLRIPSMIESSKMHNPNLPPQLPEPEISIATGFALMLETACEDFEILQRMIRHEIKLVSGNGIEDHRAYPRIQMALAKSFLFNLVRARRICDHGVGSL